VRIKWKYKGSYKRKKRVKQKNK